MTGIPTLRHPGGEEQLAPGDIVCLPDGRAGARRLTNTGPETARAIFLSTQEIPSVREYLDDRKMMVRYSPRSDAAMFPLGAGEGVDTVYWMGGLV